MPIRLFFLFLLLVTYSLACNGSITFPVAAVSENGYGRLLEITVSAMPGSGKVFMEVPPYAGMDLQRATADAVNYANDRNCDVFVSFGYLPETDYIEGPSASAAVASMTYVLVNNLSVVNRPVITGALGGGGAVLPVGGVYEKAAASASHGVPYFISPQPNIYDYIMLKKLEEKYGLRFITVRSVTDIVGFVSGNVTPSMPEYPVFESEAENISYYDAPSLAEFYPVAMGMIEIENYSIGQLEESDGEQWMVDYFEASVGENARILSQGYVYTAANNAFLTYIDLSTILFVYSEEPGYTEKADGIRQCLSGLERSRMTTENFEWVIGADLRKAWAENKMNSTDIEGQLLEEEYAYYHEIMYADSWCLAAKDLAGIGAAHGNGEEINESAWKELAADYLSEANKTTHGPETQDRFNIAKKLFDEGRYGAAIFDSAYVIAMDTGELQLSDMEEERLNASISQMLARNRSSLWANVYGSQAAYSLGKDEPDYETAYSLLMYSAYLDDAVKTMEEEAAAPAQEEAGKDTGFETAVLYSATFILLFLVLVYILPRTIRRSDEREDNKAYRAYSGKRDSGHKGGISKGKTKR